MEICANNYVYERNRAGFDITQKTNYKNDRFNSIPFRIEGFGEQTSQYQK